ncbi:MAG: hypothetical protein AAF289_11480, partial [Cyanobacteria bacterium P01_A01_bin.135]
MIRLQNRLLRQLYCLMRLLRQRCHPYSTPRRGTRSSSAGFVLPATTLLLLLVFLCVGAITLRAYDQASQATRDRQQQAVVNAASPAIDRAKAKLNHLLDRRQDPRRPAGTADQRQLHEMLRNQQEPRLTLAEGIDPYTFPGETRLDITGDGQLDNAWRYRLSLGTDLSVQPNAAVVYGIWLQQPEEDTSTPARSLKGEVRHGPLSNALEAEPLCQPRYGSDRPSRNDKSGWTPDPAHPSLQRKNFQVDVVLLPDRPDQPIATLELQQDWQLQRGFPWGVWFQDDLAITAETALSWNGALHSEGNIILDSDNTVALFPVSVPASCLAKFGASPITTGQAAPLLESSFQGHVVMGSLARDRLGGRAAVYDDGGDGRAVTLTPANDGLASGPQRPSALLLDPLQQLTEARQVPRDRQTLSQPEAKPGSQRLSSRTGGLPDRRDRFRADNRYGPAPDIGLGQIPGKIGEPIVGERLRQAPVPMTDDQLTRTHLTGDDPIGEDYGLDGYWERRARAEGLRVMVGQRLTLGEALLPWPGCSAGENCQAARQRRSLWDSPAAVQSTLFYPAHAPTPDRPSACLISTAHPGTAATLTASSTFTDRSTLLRPYLPKFYGGQPIVSNILTGEGTNGWEYAPLPAAITTESGFAAAIAPNRPLGKLLRNWAHFAGDPQGGSPSFTPSDEQVHPYPLLAAWGDAALLRRVLKLLETTPYPQLSPADKTTLHTATCTLGILAYNLGYLSQFTYPAGPEPASWRALRRALRNVNAATLASPQAVLAALAQIGVAPDILALAQTVALKEQVQRDRQWGFSPGRAASALNSPELAALLPSQPAFPALHYLLPLAPVSEATVPLWRDDTIVHLNRGWRYQAIALDAATLPVLAVVPRPLSDWQLPHQPARPGNVLSDRALYLTCEGSACGTSRRVRLAIKDAALFDGREGLLARVLDIDLNLLRQAPVSEDTWLPSSGLVYGFREDAVREDSLTRPPVASWSTCGSYRSLTSPRCQTNPALSAERGQDPPRSERGISPKPVDGHPDPDRRLHGFRIRNGARLDRGNHSQGLSLVTDGPVYILGAFNRHQTLTCWGDCPLEEFRQQLPSRPYNRQHFYRRHRLDPRFANPQQDSWRASAIWADSITVLSEQFCDGSVEDTWTTAGLTLPRLPADTMARYGCHNRDRRTSFLNQNRPRQSPTTGSQLADPWQRVVPGNPTSAIAISPQGNPLLASGRDYNNGYLQPENRPLIRAQPMSVNGIF